jgi:diketogulonate reductase-like aldo/keto reductase
MLKTFTLRNGDVIPAIGFGTFGSDHYSPEQVAAAVSEALRIGYRLIDCAEVYGNEDRIGEVLAKAFEEGVVRRDELFITSKVWNDHHAPGEPTAALERTLQNLRTSYVDAYFVHWPFPNYHAPGCDGDSRNPDSKPFSAEEFIGVWRELESLHRQGRIRHLGMSNMTIRKLAAVLPLCEVAPALIEMELHPSFQQRELFAYCRAAGIQVVGFCPIGSPNRPERDRTDADVVDTQLPEVRELAQARNLHPAEMCLLWAVSIGAIPIPFSGNPRNIASNLNCTQLPALSAEEQAIRAKAAQNCRLIKGQVFLWPGAAGWEDIWE